MKHQNNHHPPNYYLNLAEERKKTYNLITPTEMNLKMKDFIPCIYQKCYPCKYGHVFSQKIIKETNGFFKTSPHSMDNGDFHFNVGYDSFYGEIKISYKGKNGGYRITNIRDHQKFKLFLLCFVDTKKSFTPQFYVVTKESITELNFLILTAMNGTYSSNVNNKVVPKSTNVKDKDCEWFFKKHNILKGNKFSHLKQFFNEDFIKTTKFYQDFINFKFLNNGN